MRASRRTNRVSAYAIARNEENAAGGRVATAPTVSVPLAMKGNGMLRVSLDETIDTMRQTGADMQSEIKKHPRPAWP